MLYKNNQYDPKLKRKGGRIPRQLTGKPGRPAKAPTVGWLRAEAKRTENIKARGRKRKQEDVAVAQPADQEDASNIGAIIDLIMGTSSVSDAPEHAVKRAKLATDPKTTAILGNISGRMTRGTARALKAQLSA
ncbi:hypothetical protein DICSQDRAFT_175888 [Dichomitus squalens LYAD-421 SS1]|uniref:Uncharacterized protein n=1 Tax=Dichomitus squalens (strain LYAD-421) TaxID=732165 RepID=R7SK76_DICSQ|nr:uncharacterized protein DICSQDRAFT_175888 [Dichomitus squalens LYAD-421 SS1]EJF55452.1 hypothetical protein DICSQDRAFT_175888 [Dichomitus squalens LYAD-421 SS1]